MKILLIFQRQFPGVHYSILAWRVLYVTLVTIVFTTWKVSKYRVISGPYCLAFGLNTERYYSVSLRIQSECRKIRTRNIFVFGPFSRSVYGVRLDTWVTKPQNPGNSRNPGIPIFQSWKPGNLMWRLWNSCWTCLFVTAILDMYLASDMLASSA